MVGQIHQASTTVLKRQLCWATVKFSAVPSAWRSTSHHAWPVEAGWLLQCMLLQPGRHVGGFSRCRVMDCCVDVHVMLLHWQVAGIRVGIVTEAHSGISQNFTSRWKNPSPRSAYSRATQDTFLLCLCVATCSKWYLVDLQAMVVHRCMLLQAMHA
jgi:hypothetical protein